MDFTLQAYIGVLRAALDAGYGVCGVQDLMDARANPGRNLVLRHDVDRRPRNAVAMAEAEAGIGVRSTYYFRIVPTSFHRASIERIAALGHEIGYHYEDWHLARYEPTRAEQLFLDHLAKLRAIAPVNTIAMHGSPLAREDNMTIWRHCSFEAAGVRDCILSHDWSEFVFFTDTGRTFAPSRATNLRDYLGGARTVDGIASSSDLAAYLKSEAAQKVHMSVHPERWSDLPTIWTRQWGWDVSANLAKRALGVLRKPDTGSNRPSGLSGAEPGAAKIGQSKGQAV